VSFLSRLFGGQPRNYSSAGPAISGWQVGQPVWTQRRFDRLADEAYLRNAIAFRCVQMISTACATIPWKLNGRDGKKIEKHELLDLLKRPGPAIGGQEMFEAFFAYLLLEGNTYLEGVSASPNRPPLELWPQRPDRMKVIAGGQGVPQGYRYENLGMVKDWEVDFVTGMSPIMHLKEFHPLNDWYGLARTEPAAYGIDRHNASSAHNKALLDNGARPSGVLAFKPVEGVAAPEPIMKAAEERLHDRHTGSHNAGRPMVVGGDVSWVDMAISPRDMDFGKGKDDAARDICIGYGVPHLLVVPGASTYNNRKEARLELYEDTVLPLCERALDKLNAWLTPRYGDGLELAQDLDQVPALEPRREAKRKAVVELWKSGLIRRDEGRQGLQYEPAGGEIGEEYCVPSVAGEESEGAPPQDPPEPDTKTNDK
jgi:HK97 family phage portal protein